MLQLAGFLLIALCAVAQARPQGDVGVHDVIPGIGEYYFNGIAANWTTAYRQCQASGGHLTVINSVAEKEALQEMITRHGAYSVLVGFHDQFVEGVYTFITGWTVPDSLWAPGSPRGGPTNNCGYLNENGVYDASCSAMMPFICELSEDQGGETNGDGYSVLGNFGHYKFHNETLAWPLAWDVCRKENADLLVLDSQEELDALWLAYDKFELFVWLGVHRLWGPNDGFVTTNNTPLSQVGYQQWYLNLGTYLTNPYVGLVNIEGMLTQGDYKAPFFCKRPLL